MHWISEILLIVSFSATVLSKRRHFGVDLHIPAGEVWLRFRQTWWGDPRKDVAAVRKHSSSSHFLHIDHAEVRQSLNLYYDDFLVREEYLLFAERCWDMRERSDRMGCLILGQEGIGPLIHTPTSFLTNDHVSFLL